MPTTPEPRDLLTAEDRAWLNELRDLAPDPEAVARVRRDAARPVAKDSGGWHH